MAKRRKSDDISISSLLNWDLCLYCQSQTNENLRCPGSLVREKHDPKVVYEKIAKNIREFKKIDALPIDLYLDEGNDNLGKLFIENSAKFHKSCTNMFSDMKLERALKRVKKAANDSNSDQQGGDEEKTQSSNGEISERRTSMRSKTSNLLKCIFCDSTEGELHEVSTFPLEKKVRRCATVLNDHILLGKLSVGDMMAQDAMYHMNCILALYMKAKPKNPENETDGNETEKQIHAQVLAELALYMEQGANEETGTVFKLSELATIYKTRVQELGGHTPERIHTTKSKNRLMLQVDNLKEFKSKNDHCYLCFDENVGDVLKSFYEMDWDNEAFILAEAAKYCAEMYCL